MKELAQLQKESEKTVTDVFRESMLLAFERTGSELFDIENLITDVLQEFKGIKQDELKESLRRGSLGHYGVTYKLTIQVVCYWIISYRESKKILF